MNTYEAIDEASTAKKAARKLLRQIEESEERAEIVEVRAAGPSGRVMCEVEPLVCPSRPL